MTTPTTAPPPIGTVVVFWHSGEETVIDRRFPPSALVDVWRFGVAGQATLMEWDGSLPSALAAPVDSMYTYINAVLDENPTVAQLELPDTGPTGAYAVATGPVPGGERSILGRVTVTAAAPGILTCTGYDLTQGQVISFIA